MKKLILGATALATVAVFAAACSSSKSSGAKTLTSGQYEYDIANVAPDSCFNAATESLLKTPGLLKFALVSTSATAFTLNPPGLASGVIPPIVGTRTGDALAAAGNTIYAVTSACSIAITANATGNVTANDEFDADIAIGLSAATTASNGNPSNCAYLAGGSLPGTSGAVPFPTLTPTSNGTCALTLSGHAFLTP